MDSLTIMINVTLAVVTGMFISCQTESCRAQDVSIYDSPSDKSKVVIETCNNGRCHKLITDKRTLEEDQPKITDWFNAVNVINTDEKYER